MAICAWWVRVSAALDDELDDLGRSAVTKHVTTCVECAHRTQALAELGIEGPRASSRPSRLSAVERRWLEARWPRVLLAMLGMALVVLAAPQFVGADLASHERHGARHLATWQAGFGCGLVIAAFRSRFGEALLTVAAAMGVLTALATSIDVVGSRRDPVDELVHLVELGGIVLLWWMAPPHLRPRLPRRRSTLDLDTGAGPRRLMAVPDPMTDRPGR